MGSYENMAGRLLTDASKAEGSFATDNLRAVAVELDQIEAGQIDLMPYRVFPTLALGEDLTLAAANFGVTRREAAKANVALTITGDEGTAIDASVKAVAGDIIFALTEEAVIPAGGAVNVTAEAEEPGAEGNVLAGSINEFITAYAGLETVSNAAAASGGADEESDEDLLIRVKARWQTPSTGGNRGDYIRWALEAGGVSRVKVFNPSAGNVSVYIIASGNLEANPALITNVSEYIEDVRPVGAGVTVASGTAVLINVSATVVLLEGYTANGVQTAAAASLDAYLVSQAFAAQTISYLRIAEILFVDGVADVVSYTLNGGTASITLGATEFGQIGTVSITT